MNLAQEAGALLTYFEERGLKPQEACVVMGLTIRSLIADPQTAEEFIRTLQASLKRKQRSE